MKLTALTTAALLFAAPVAIAQTTTVTPDAVQSGAVNSPAAMQAAPPANDATTATATAAPAASQVTAQTVANAPIPDTQATRAKYPPLSHAGKASDPAGN